MWSRVVAEQGGRRKLEEDKALSVACFDMFVFVYITTPLSFSAEKERCRHKYEFNK